MNNELIESNWGADVCLAMDRFYQANPILATITPEGDVVFYHRDGTEQYRCPLTKLVEALRTLVEA